MGFGTEAKKDNDPYSAVFNIGKWAVNRAGKDLRNVFNKKNKPYVEKQFDRSGGFTDPDYIREEIARQVARLEEALAKGKQDDRFNRRGRIKFLSDKLAELEQSGIVPVDDFMDLPGIPMPTGGDPALVPGALAGLGKAINVFRGRILASARPKPKLPKPEKRPTPRRRRPQPAKPPPRRAPPRPKRPGPKEPEIPKGIPGKMPRGTVPLIILTKARQALDRALDEIIGRKFRKIDGPQEPPLPPSKGPPNRYPRRAKLPQVEEDKRPVPGKGPAQRSGRSRRKKEMTDAREMRGIMAQEKARMNAKDAEKALNAKKRAQVKKELDAMMKVYRKSVKRQQKVAARNKKIFTALDAVSSIYGKFGNLGKQPRGNRVTNSFNPEKPPLFKLGSATGLEPLLVAKEELDKCWTQCRRSTGKKKRKKKRVCISPAKAAKLGLLGV